MLSLAKREKTAGYRALQYQTFNDRREKKVFENSSFNVDFSACQSRLRNKDVLNWILFESLNSDEVKHRPIWNNNHRETTEAVFFRIINVFFM